MGPTRYSGGTHVGPTCYSDGTHVGPTRYSDRTHVGPTVLLSEPFYLKKLFSFHYLTIQNIFNYFLHIKIITKLCILHSHVVVLLLFGFGFPFVNSQNIRHKKNKFLRKNCLYLYTKMLEFGALSDSKLLCHFTVIFRFNSIHRYDVVLNIVVNNIFPLIF